MKMRLLALVFVCVPTLQTNAETINECKELLRTGKYVECLDAATEAVERRSYGEDWPMIKAEAEIRLGRYLQAEESINAGLQRYAWSIRLRMKAYDLFSIIGGRDKGQRLIEEVAQLASQSPWRYTDADDLVALGKTSIALGADPKDVLEGFYNRARRNYKTRPDGFMAAGRLAFEKGDGQLAADILTPVAEQFGNIPEFLFLLSEVLSSSAPEKAVELSQRAAQINPNFDTVLLKLAEQQIDAESYSQAEQILDEVLKTNPWHPDAHAYQAVIHHLRNQPIEEAKSRSAAMVFSGASAIVDHKIGEKLSRKYRFAEGAQYQQMALQADPFYLPAKSQLAQDLLRLGRDDEGWQLADEAQKQDKYSTTLFNLMQLKNSLSKFSTIENERFIIRMDSQEAAVYGHRVESLLNLAFETTSKKYGYTPTEPVVVEIFDRQDDFAVRTFGLPDVAGFLGVCFGKLITANSPASQRDNPNNWESVLWHEFCHVITLQMTGNKIPRWLSEGISVYEERVQDSRWGQSMSPTFRQRVLDGNVTPVSELSSAFLNAKSGADLNFAYYESSMVVEFIVQEYGFDTLLGVLADLNQGLSINDALERNTTGLQELNSAFESYLNKVATDFAVGVEFNIPSADDPREIDLGAITNAPPNHYTFGLSQAAQLIREEKLSEAETKLLQLVELYPEDNSGNGARKLLATVYERQQRPEQQAAVLTTHMEKSSSDLAAATTLLKLQIEKEKWTAALKTGQTILAIDPLQPTALRSLLRASTATQAEEVSISLLNGLLQLEPADAARWHYQLASIHDQSSDTAKARRHVLLSLEQAPRYRDAHRLLQKIKGNTESAAESPAESD